MTALAAAALVAAGCGRDATSLRQVERQPAASKPAAREDAPRWPRDTGAKCPPRAQVLIGVYRPQRLKVLDACRRATGEVRYLHGSHDGDRHLLVRVDDAFRALLNAGNRSHASGHLVVELMPRDVGRFPLPEPGTHVEVIGAWVLDTQTGWNELHPVWVLTMEGRTFRSGPWAGGTPPWSPGRFADVTCTRKGAKPCGSYD